MSNENDATYPWRGECTICNWRESLTTPVVTLGDDPAGELSGAALHRARAVADAIDAGGDWWRKFDIGDHEDDFPFPCSEWHQCTGPVHLFEAIIFERPVRIKPATRTITANGVDYTFPEPMRMAPETHENYWVPDISYGEARAAEAKWVDSSTDYNRFNSGMCYRNSYDAKQKSKALIDASRDRA